MVSMYTHTLKTHGHIWTHDMHVVWYRQESSHHNQLTKNQMACVSVNVSAYFLLNHVFMGLLFYLVTLKTFVQMYLDGGRGCGYF